MIYPYILDRIQSKSRRSSSTVRQRPYGAGQVWGVGGYRQHCNSRDPQTKGIRDNVVKETIPLCF